MSHLGMDGGRWRRPERLATLRPTALVIDHPHRQEALVTASAPTLAAPTRPFGRPLTAASVAASAALMAATTLTVTMAYLAIAHVAGGMRFGDGTHSAIVDSMHVVTALALLPIPFALHRLLGHTSPRLSAAGVALAVDAIAFAAILHALFALGVIAFDAAGPLLLIGYLAFAGWLWTVGSLGSASGTFPNGRRMAVVGATIVGLPVWLAWIARRLDEV
jgi:hypothetical protein